MNLIERALGEHGRRRFLKRIASLTVAPADASVVEPDELSDLPLAAQRFLRWAGIVGRPRTWSFAARFEGTFRRGPDGRWMPLRAWQYNAVDPVTRVFDMRVDVGPIPMFASDTYIGGQGRMLGKVFGLITVAKGSGTEFDIGELVTYLNDACLVAPSMLLAPGVTWRAADDGAFEVSISAGPTEAAARVTVGDDGRLVDFVTRDRWCDLPSGLVRAEWSTPVGGWLDVGGRRVPTEGGARWRLDDGSTFEYVRGRFLPESFRFNLPPNEAGGIT